MLSNHGIGGNEVPLNTNEAIFEIPQNRTIIAQKLTDQDPLRPQLVEGLNSIEKVFAHFQPEINVEFETGDGAFKLEKLQFQNMGDFGVKGITQQSHFLAELETEKNQYQKIIRQMKSNKILRTALEDPEARKSLYETLQSLIVELEEKK